jgi:hypothetical protein
MIRFILKASTAVLACLLLSGCGTTFISGNVSTSVDPSFNANPYSRLVVMPKDLDAVYYLPVAKEALENRGFKNVSISRSNKLSTGNYDVSVLLDVGRHISEKTETVKDYGVVGQDIEWGDTKCKTTNNGLTGDRMRCRTGKTEVENIYGVTGTREVTTTSLDRSISLSFFSLPNNQSVISAIGTSDEADYKCSNSGIYKFLITNTIKRLDFGTPRNYDYTVELPEGYNCESSLEYERSLRVGLYSKSDPSKAIEDQVAIRSSASQAKLSFSSEYESYIAASNLILKDKDIYGALSSFDRHLSDYPSGVYTANAYYWMANIYRLTDQHDKADLFFTAVVEQYPDHPKASEAQKSLLRN